MALSQSTIDKLLKCFSSSEDEELEDKESEEDEKDFDRDFKPCIVPFANIKENVDDKEEKKVLIEKKETLFEKNLNQLNEVKKQEKGSDDEIKVVELEVKPITIDDSDNETKTPQFIDIPEVFESNSENEKPKARKRRGRQKKEEKRVEEEEEKEVKKKLNVDSDTEEEFVEVKRKGRRKKDPVGSKRCRTRKNRPKIGRNIKCKHCDLKLKNEQLFLFHMQTHDGYKETDCVVCDAKFESIPKLQEHYAQWDKLKTDPHYIKLRPFTCSHCDLRYKSRNYLMDHLDLHAGEKKFLCPICGKQFYKRFSLKVHLKYHQKSYHSCERCKIELQFRNPKEYIAHCRVVHGENPHKCPICGREFTRRHDMLKHKDLHNREPNCCTQCNIFFDFRREFNQHMKEVHNRIKKYTCTICNKVFLMHCKLTRHIETHNKIRENCNLCGKEFRSRRDFNAHMRNMHGVMLDLPKTETKKGAPRKTKAKAITNEQIQEPDKEPVTKEEDTKFDVKIDMKAQDFSGYLLKNKNNF